MPLRIPDLPLKPCIANEKKSVDSSKIISIPNWLTAYTTHATRRVNSFENKGHKQTANRLKCTNPWEVETSRRIQEPRWNVIYRIRTHDALTSGYGTYQ